MSTILAGAEQLVFEFEVAKDGTVMARDTEYDETYSLDQMIRDVAFCYQDPVVLGADCKNKKGVVLQKYKKVEQLIAELCEQRDRDIVEDAIEAGECCPQCHKFAESKIGDESWKYCPWCGTKYNEI